jgi:hypothetical protein
MYFVCSSSPASHSTSLSSAKTSNFLLTSEDDESSFKSLFLAVERFAEIPDI